MLSKSNAILIKIRKIWATNYSGSKWTQRPEKEKLPKKSISTNKDGWVTDLSVVRINYCMRIWRNENPNVDTIIYKSAVVAIMKQRIGAISPGLKKKKKSERYTLLIYWPKSDMLIKCRNGFKSVFSADLPKPATRTES